MAKYYIVNDVDRPDEDHVTIETLEGLKYLCERLKDWPAMGKGPGATNLKEFGFYITEDKGIVSFEKLDSSTAEYSNGKQRFWQGSPEFSFKLS